jgi:hypothetical protein
MLPLDKPVPSHPKLLNRTNRPSPPHPSPCLPCATESSASVYGRAAFLSQMTTPAVSTAPESRPVDTTVPTCFAAETSLTGWPCHPQQKANLARIRDNQRRSRARRREYLQELEQRLRVCELQGVEASAEVQMAARRVADENRQLRELLNRYGVTDEYIAHYLQAYAASNPESSQGQTIRPGEAGAAAQSLQQLMIPRRAAHLEQAVPFTVPSQSSREDSITSASTANSSVWESAQSTIPYNHHPQQLTVPPPDHRYSSSVFPTQPATTQSGHFHQSSSSGQMMNDPQHNLATNHHPVPADSRSTMGYQFPLNPYSDPTNRYGPHGGAC